MSEPSHKALTQPLDTMSDVPDSVKSNQSTMSIKKRVAIIMKRREEEGPPSPTEKFPYPDADLRCRFCKRIFRVTRNPIRNRPSPFLEQSRLGARDCAPCRNMQNLWMKGTPKEEIEVKNRVDDAYFWTYSLALFLWEDRNANPRECVVKVIDDIPPELKIKIFQEESLEVSAELMLGVVWPVAIYKKKEGHEPLKGEVQEHAIGNFKVKGVLRDIEHGNPRGTYLMKQKAAVGVRKVTEVGNSETAVRGLAQLKEIFHAIQGRLHVTVSDGKNAGNKGASDGMVKIKGGTEMDDGLDDLWADAPVVFTNKVCAPSKRSAPSAVPPGENPPPQVPKRPKVGAKREMDLDVSEQVVLKAKQAITNFEQEDTSCSVQPKKFSGVLDSVRSRMKPSLLETYMEEVGDKTATPRVAEGVDGAVPRRSGMSILEDLRAVELKMDLCVPLLEAITSGKLDLDALGNAAKDALRGGVRLTKAIVKKSWETVANTYYDQKEWANWVESLVQATTPLPHEMMAILGPEDAMTFQEEYVTPKVVKMLSSPTLSLEEFRSSRGGRKV